LFGDEHLISSIIGIGALVVPGDADPPAQRLDRWQPETFLARAKTTPTATLARWLVKVGSPAGDFEMLFEDFLWTDVVSVADLSNPSISGG